MIKKILVIVLLGCGVTLSGASQGSSSSSAAAASSSSSSSAGLLSSAVWGEQVSGASSSTAGSSSSSSASMVIAADAGVAKSAAADAAASSSGSGFESESDEKPHYDFWKPRFEGHRVDQIIIGKPNNWRQSNDMFRVNSDVIKGRPCLTEADFTVASDRVTRLNGEFGMAISLVTWLWKDKAIMDAPGLRVYGPYAIGGKEDRTTLKNLKNCALTFSMPSIQVNQGAPAASHWDVLDNFNVSGMTAAQQVAAAMVAGQKQKREEEAKKKAVDLQFPGASIVVTSSSSASSSSSSASAGPTSSSSSSLQTNQQQSFAACAAAAATAASAAAKK